MADGSSAGKVRTARKMAKAPNPFVARAARSTLRNFGAAARAGGTQGARQTRRRAG